MRDRCWQAYTPPVFLYWAVLLKKTKIMITEVTTKIDVTPTEEEKQWVKALASGEKAVKIAEHFGMNRNTFAYHLRFLRAKFQCKNTNQLISYFLRNNLID